ncbi:MAG: glycosyltransferase family 39 protein [Candidatus Methanomethylicaceae archaeon]
MSCALYGILTFVTLLAISWVISQHPEEKAFLRIVMLSSFCYGVFISVFVRTIFGDILESPSYFPDAYFYLSYATSKVAEWRGEGALGYIPLATRGYTYFIAIIFLIFGQNIYAVIFAQLLLSSLISTLTFLIAREFFDIKTVKSSTLLIGFFPDLYVWASFALKEVIAVFSICLAVLHFLKFRKHPNLVRFLATIGPLVFLLFVRPHVAFFLGFIFMLAFMWPVAIKKLIWLPIGVAIFAKFMSQAQLPSFLTIVSETHLPIYSRGEILVTGTLPEYSRMIISGQLLSNLLLGIGRYLISPLPWQADNAYQAVIPGVVLWYLLLPVAIWGAIGAIRARKHVYILLVVVLFLIFWYGLFLTGTDPRWRLMIMPFMCIFSAYGFKLLKRSLSGVTMWISMEFAIGFFLSLYALGLKFVLSVLMPILAIGTLVSLNVFRKHTGEVVK